MSSLDSNSVIQSKKNGLTSSSAAQTLLESVLSRDSSSKQKGKIPVHLSTNPPSEDYSSRVQDKRIQLQNPDRPRPKNDPNDIKEIKRRARDERIRKRVGEASKSRPSSSTSSKGKPKGKIHNRELKHLKNLDSTKFGKGKRKKKLTYDSTSQERDEARRSGAKLPLSRKEKMNLGLMGKDKNLSPQTLHPLHLLWTAYMHQLLGLVDSEGNPSSHALSSANGSWSISQVQMSSMQANVCKADLCGSLIRVIRSTNPALVHLSGVIASETANTLVLIPLEENLFFPPDNSQKPSNSSRDPKYRPRVIPKQNSVFTLSIPLPERPSLASKPDEKPETQYLEFSLHGNQMMQSLPARTSRKYKPRKTVEF